MEQIFWSDEEDMLSDMLSDVEDSPVGKKLKTNDAPAPPAPATLLPPVTTTTTTVHRLSTKDKAGLDGDDEQERIDQILAQQKNGKFFEQERRRERRVDEKVQKLRKKLVEMGKQDERRGTDMLAQHRIASVERQISKLASALEQNRDLSHWCLTVDMDAFFLAVELLDLPELRGKPVAVGGPSMLSTSSYEARKFGVRSAMPGFIAMQLCPELIIIPSNFAKYSKVGAEIRAVFAIFDSNFVSHSLDEASLDITDYCLTHNMSAEAVGLDLKQRVFEATQCTCSVGIACNRSLAKICSNINKPDGLYILNKTRADIVSFVAQLPLRKVHGIGPIAEATLSAIGFQTPADLWENRFVLSRLFKESTVQFYLDVALGFPSSTFELPEEHERKSIGHERTFNAHGISDFAEAREIAHRLTRKLVNEMQEKRISGRTLTVILKGIDFQRNSRSKTLDRDVSGFDEVWPRLHRLLESLFAEVGPFRLLGVRLSNLKMLEER